MKTFLLAATIALCPALAHAQMVVLGQGAPQSCYQSAKTGDLGSLAAIRNCTDALDGILVKQDEAATYVNRGVLLMRRGNHDKAVMDYQKALKIRPDLAEAYINYGAALFYQGENARALEAYNTALSLETDKKADALFNRALVYERMDNPKGAYYDLKAALDLRPDWPQARDSLERFTVTRRQQS
jgi:tetratricopeptide (TPR) repeat protein